MRCILYQKENTKLLFQQSWLVYMICCKFERATPLCTVLLGVLNNKATVLPNYKGHPICVFYVPDPVKESGQPEVILSVVGRVVIPLQLPAEHRI